MGHLLAIAARATLWLIGIATGLALLGFVLFKGWILASFPAARTISFWGAVAFLLWVFALKRRDRKRAAETKRIQGARREPAVRLLPCADDSGTSWLGGHPLLPPGTDWPRSGRGVPMHFRAQVDLAKVPQLPAGNLPADGLLLFFFDQDEEMD